MAAGKIGRLRERIRSCTLCPRECRVDRAAGEHGIPDTGKFGFRLIGSDVKAEVRDFRVYAIEPHPIVTQTMQRSGL